MTGGFTVWGVFVFTLYILLRLATSFLIYIATTIPPPAYLYVTPVDPKVVANSYVVLSCNCGCSIQPQWFKNNQSIRFVEPGSPYNLLANGSLRISVSRQTAGNYSCEVRTFSWHMRSKQVNLEVWCKYTFTGLLIFFAFIAQSDLVQGSPIAF